MHGGLIRNLALMLADVACIASCWTLAVLGYYAFGGHYDPAIYLRLWPVVPAFVGLNVLFRLYHGRVFYPAAPFAPVEELRRLVGAAFLLHVGVVATLALMHQTTEGFSRVVIVLSGVLTALSVQSVRNLVRAILRRIGIGQIPVALVGPASSATSESRSAAWRAGVMRMWSSRSAAGGV